MIKHHKAYFGTFSYHFFSNLNAWRNLRQHLKRLKIHQVFLYVNTSYKNTVFVWDHFENDSKSLSISTTNVFIKSYFFPNNYLPVTLCHIEAMLAVTLFTKPPAILLACWVLIICGVWGIAEPAGISGHCTCGTCGKTNEIQTIFLYTF